MQKARIGVIGCGWWATEAHLPALKRNPRAIIAALADPDSENLRRASRIFPSKHLFSDAREMVEAVELDGVIVAVPHAYHFRLAQLVLSHHLHVLVEKPMTLSPVEGRTLLQEARSRQLEIVISYPWHYNRHALAIRKAVSEERIGQIEAISCTYGSKSRILYEGVAEPIQGYTHTPPAPSTYSDPSIAGGGQAPTQTTHAAALLFFLTGLTPSSIQCSVENFDLGVDLANAVAFRTKEGAVGTLMSTGSILARRNAIFDIHILGRDGNVVFNVEEGTAVIRTTRKITRLSDLPARQRYPWWRPADNLVDLCLGRGENGSPPELGLTAVEFIAAMYRSSAERRSVLIEELQEHHT